MHKMANSTLGFIVLVLLISLLSSAPVAADEYEAHMAMEQLIYADGSVEINHYMWDDESGEWIAVESASGVRSAPPGGWDALLITQYYFWHQKTKKINFDFTPDSFPYKKKFKKSMNKFLNKHRGTGAVPRFKTVGRTLQVNENLPDGQYDGSYQWQFRNDDHNTIVMTDDDRFFLYDREDLVARTWILRSASIQQVNNRWEGTYYWEEADMFFRYDFFNGATAPSVLPASFVTDRILAAQYRFALGYPKTTWTDDVTSDETPHVTQETLYAKKSDVWTQSDNRDNLHYNGGWQNAVKMGPVENTVIDVANAAPPEEDAPASLFDENATQMFAVTTLKGFPKKKLTLSIHRVVPDSPPSLVLVTRMIGSSTGWEQQHSQIGTWYSTYFGSLLYFGRDGNYNDVVAAINQHGRSRTIRGVHYDHALDVRFQLQGPLVEKGKNKTINRYFTLVNSNEEED